MHILIFGATGGTGRQLVSQGLEKGHHVTAFVRNPAALAINNNKLTVIKGNILNALDVTSAMKSQDVVISALGSKTKDAFWKSSTIISEGVKNILEGMKKNKVKRLLFLASFGVNEEIFLPEKLFIRIVLKNIFADIPVQEKLIKESTADWTIVHPARLVNGIKSGSYTIGEHVRLGLFSKISRADVAAFLLTCMSSADYIHKTVTISY